MNIQSERLSALLARFNPQQHAAVMNTVGPELIIAGAGSGKTSVLTARIALLLEQGVMPERILALTFTKKAADEMCRRIVELEGDSARRLCMGTFHSVFIRLIRPYASRIGFPMNFTILDEEDSRNCIKRCIDEVVGVNRPPKETWSEAERKRYEEEDAKFKPKSIACGISNLKNDLVSPNRHDEIMAEDEALMGGVSEADRVQRERFSRIYHLYMRRCHNQGTMDFDDILFYMNLLLERYPDIRRDIASMFDYIMVDEYQDTNVAQYQVLRYLSETNRNVCVVGDDSQSIYAFRGAKIQNILRFEREYVGCRLFKLETNYRSTKTIVTVANRLIENNQRRIPKTCVAANAETEGSIRFNALENENAEADFIATSIANKLADPKCNLSYRDFAVLYRTNSQSRALEDALMKKGIPYMIYSGVSFFERTEVKDLMAYFRLAVNPHDDEAMRRVINKPGRGIGPKAVANITGFADYMGVTLWKAVTLPEIETIGLSPAALRGVMKLRESIGFCIACASSQTAYEAANHILDMTGFYSAYANDKSEESQSRADNLRELIDSVKTYEDDLNKLNESLPDESKKVSSLIDFIQNVMLLSNADTSSDDGNVVSLMTVHCSKGLEFDTVAVAGLEKSLFPLDIDKTPDSIEEERRLFYVAITRAKTDLMLTMANTRMKFGKRTDREPSQFIRELMKDPTEIDEYTRKTASSAPKKYYGNFYKKKYKP